MAAMVLAMLTKRLYEEVDLLSRHLRVLKVVMEYQPIGIIRISKLLGIEAHEVRNSLSTLESNGFIVATPSGAMIKEDIKDKVLQVAQSLKEIRNSIDILRKEYLELVM